MDASICVAKAETVDNTGQLVRFQLDGTRPYTRRLVNALGEGFENEVSIRCPVGQALVGMSPGDEALIKVPGGERMLLTLLAVGDGALDHDIESTGGDNGENEQ